MSGHTFGGSWTEDKLGRVRKYLAAYTKIFRRNPKAQFFKTTYVDAFAGTGYRSDPHLTEDHPHLFEDPDAQEFLKGSARIALEVEPSFDRYLFIDLNPAHAQELEALKSEFPEKSGGIGIVSAEANAYLKQWCKETDWKKNRAVVFLDPYGMQVEWSTIEAISQTKGIDLWILFPLGVAVSRLLTKGKLPPEAWQQALTRSFGTNEWKEVFYDPQTTPSLLGEDEVQYVRAADFEKIGRFFVSRLRSVFPGVAENALPLRNSKNVPIFLLCFAASNERGAPLALKIANHILRH